MNKIVTRISIFFDILKDFLVAVLVTVLILAFTVGIAHNLLKINEVSGKYTGQYKKLYNAGDNRMMNVYSIGQGEKTLVILSGFGLQSPVLEYKSLANYLSTDCRVVIVEYLGYGYSLKANTERTSENIVKEVKAALTDAGISGPYTLVPHSISNVYAIKYQKMYPEDVSAIISIDGLMPNMTSESEFIEELNRTKTNVQVSSIAEFTGFARILSYVKPEKLDDYVENVTYATCTNIPYEKIITRTFNIKNIDFGIEYRPEAEISLNKEIKTIQLVTSDSNVLMKIPFQDVLDADGNVQVNDVTGRILREVDLDNAIGLQNIQFICNNNRLQGFAYINVDDEILQGSKITVEYEFTVENISEIDRISTNLDNLRYKENEVNAIATDSTQRAKYVDENNYLGSETAEKYLYDLVFDKDETYASDDDYRVIEKTMTTGNDNYYGRYLGSTYFTSNISSKDTIVDLKIDKILDYIDTDLSFTAEENIGENHFWTTTTSEELLTGDGINGGLVSKDLFVNVSDNNTNQDLRLVNLKGVAFDTDLISNLAVSMDDRESDTQTDVINKQLSKFLEPKTVNTTAEEYSGEVSLTAEKIISSETDTDNLSFENIAEIIQYTCTSGRRTNFATTIGNVNVKAETGEYLESLIEKDTSATEVITLSPPTGLNRIQNMIVNTVQSSAKVIILVTIIVVIIIATTVSIPIVIKHYKNRPIK